MNSAPQGIFFDFSDGNGFVPAHKHPFGGGWVANTAEVDDSVYIAPLARIFGHAKIYNNVKIGGFSKISGYAQIRDNVCIGGKVSVQGYALVEGNVILEKECFVGAGTHLAGNFKISDHAMFMQATRCLECPLLQVTAYGSTQESPCANCFCSFAQRNKETRAYIHRLNGKYASLSGLKDLAKAAFEGGNSCKSVERKPMYQE